MIENKPFPESSQIEMASYDTESMVLTIKFRKSGTYKYFNIPIDIWTKMKVAESVGKFLNQEIKIKFNYEKIS